MASALPLDASPCRGIIQGQQFAFAGRHQRANDGCIIVREDDGADYPDEMYIPDDHLQTHSSNDGADEGMMIVKSEEGVYDHEAATTSGDGSDEPLALDDYQQQDSMGSSGCGSADGKSSRQSYQAPSVPRSVASKGNSSPAQVGTAQSAAGPIRNNSQGTLPNKRWNGQRWNDNETKTLIDLFGKYPNLIGRRLWETIGEGLRARGFHRTDSQAREKWRDVYTFYKRNLETLQKTGEFPDVPFFKQLHAIYSKRAPPSSTGSWGRSPASAIARSSPMELAKNAIPPVSAVSMSPTMAPPALAPVAHQKAAPLPEGKKETPSPQAAARSSPGSSTGTLNLSQQSVISSTQRSFINQPSQSSSQPQPQHHLSLAMAQAQQQALAASVLQQTRKQQQQPVNESISASSTHVSSSNNCQNRQTELLEKIVKMQEQQLRMQSQLLQLERKRVANETKQTEFLGRLVAMLGDLDDMEDINGGDEMFVGDNSGEQLN